MGYSAKVRITSNGGATVYNLLVPTGDETPGNVTATYGLADPLIVKQSLTAGDRGILAHPDPEEATITLIGADSTTYADIALGDPVAVMIYGAVSYAGSSLRFCGRVAGISSKPHPLGVMTTLSCVDYTADLREIPVGQGAWPLEMCHERVNRVTDEIGWQHPARNWTFTLTPKVAAKAAGELDAYSAVVSTLDTWVTTQYEDETGTAFSTALGHTMGYRPRMVQNVTGADEAGLLFTDQPFTLAIQSGAITTRRAVYAPPARLTNVAGVRTVTVAAADSSPSTGAPILDGARVSFDVTLSQAKGQGLGNVTRATDAAGTRVTFDWRTAQVWAVQPSNLPWWYQGGYPALPATAGPSIVQDIDSILDATDTAGPGSLVGLYRAPFRPEPRLNWTTSTLSWQAWAEPSAFRRPELTELLTVSHVAGKLATNREWIVGLVSGTAVSVAKGRVTVDIDLLPFSYDYDLNRFIKGSALGTISYDSAILSTVTYTQLAARDTFNDYAIVRGS